MMSMKTALNTSALVTADSPEGQRAAETFRAQYNKSGLNEDSAGILNEHPGFAAYLLTGIRRFSTNAPDYILAQSILGADFITPEEVSKSRGIVYTEDQIIKFGYTLPSQEVLVWCRNNSYMVIAGPNQSLSLIEVRELKCEYFYSRSGGWYSEQKFAHNDKVDTRWIMVRKKPVPESTSKTWDEQQELLSDVEVTPNVAEVVWAITTYKAVRDIYLLPNMYVRTSSLDLCGHRVNVGLCDVMGICVNFWYDDVCRFMVGVSSARK